jgi:hypothetical protein
MNRNSELFSKPLYHLTSFAPPSLEHRRSIVFNMAAKKSATQSLNGDGLDSNSSNKPSRVGTSKRTEVDLAKSIKTTTLKKFQIVHVPEAIYGVLYEGQPLLTSLGGRHPVQHSSFRFLEHLVLELSERGELVVDDGVVLSPQGFDSYSLLGLQREWIASETDNFSTGLVGELVCDGTLEQPPIDIYAHQVGYYMPVKDWLAALGARLVDLDFVDFDKVDGIPDGYGRMNGGMGDEDTEDFLDLLRVLTNVFKQLSPQQRAAAVYLNNITRSSAVFSLCLAAGGCSAEEYGAGVAARDAGGASERVFKKASKEREAAASKALRFIELASGEIHRKPTKEENV